MKETRLFKNYIKTISFDNNSFDKNNHAGTLYICERKLDLLFIKMKMLLSFWVQCTQSDSLDIITKLESF